MKTLDISQATESLAAYAQGVTEESIILTEKGQPVAALISIQDIDWETIKLSSDPQFMQIIEQSRARQKKEGSVSSEEMRRRLSVK